MKKRIKFPLEMRDGVQVRTLEDLRENFDLEKACEAFTSGKLLTWLEERYYEEEAEQVGELEQSDVNLKKKLCQILGVEWIGEDSVDLDEIALRQEKLAKLKQLTDDEDILSKVDQVAFDQEDLGDLLDEGVKEIILCDNKFVIPLRVKNIHYRGIGKVTAEIKSSQDVSLDEMGILLENAEIICPNSVKVFAEKSKDVAGVAVNSLPKDEDYEVYVKAVPYYRFRKDNTSFASLEPVVGSEEITPGMAAIYCRNKINGRERFVDVICPISESLFDATKYNCWGRFGRYSLEDLLKNLQNSFKVHNGSIYYLKAGGHDMENMYYPHLKQYILADAGEGFFKQPLGGDESVQLISKQRLLQTMKSLSPRHSLSYLWGSVNNFYGASENKIIFQANGVGNCNGEELYCVWEYDENTQELKVLDYTDFAEKLCCIYSDNDSTIYYGKEKVTQYFMKQGFRRVLAEGYEISYEQTDEGLTGDRRCYSAIVFKNGVYYSKYVSQRNIYRFDLDSNKRKIVATKIGSFEGFCIENGGLYILSGKYEKILIDSEESKNTSSPNIASDPDFIEI